VLRGRERRRPGSELRLHTGFGTRASVWTAVTERSAVTAFPSRRRDLACRQAVRCPSQSAGSGRRTPNALRARCPLPSRPQGRGAISGPSLGGIGCEHQFAATTGPGRFTSRALTSCLITPHFPFRTSRLSLPRITAPPPPGRTGTVLWRPPDRPASGHSPGLEPWPRVPSSPSRGSARPGPSCPAHRGP